MQTVHQIEEIELLHSFQSSPPSETLTENLSTRRRNNRRWKINFLRCFSPLNDEVDTCSYTDVPPTYSSIYGNRDSVISSNPAFLQTNHSSFVAPVPPPSYAQSERITTSPFAPHESLSNIEGRWLPWPIHAICPRCVTIVVTIIEVRRSAFTHIMAVILFLCGCWPCCMIPYCINPCKITDHYCPICHTYLGSYKPW